MTALDHTAPPNGTTITADVHAHFDEEIKNASDHVEHDTKVDQLTASLSTIPRSAFAHLGPSEAIRVFKRQFLIGTLASVGAL